MKKFGYKKGDRVQGATTDRFGTVVEDQTTQVVSVRWDGDPETGSSGIYQVYLRPVPWHGLRLPQGYAPVLHFDIDAVVAGYRTAEPFTEAGSLGGAVKAKPAESFLYKKGDRVKLKYNRKCGTVHKDQTDFESSVCILWDHRADTLWEMADDLVILHAPRDTDPVNPNQEAIDAIEALRVPLKKEIEALQAKLSSLTQAKKLLERG